MSVFIKIDRAALMPNVMFTLCFFRKMAGKFDVSYKKKCNFLQ